MKVFEVLGFKKSPEKLIKKIAKQFSHRSGYLRYAHTKKRYEKNRKYFDQEAENFRKLQQRFHDGEDVTNDLEELSKRIAKAFRNFF